MFGRCFGALIVFTVFFNGLASSKCTTSVWSIPVVSFPKWVGLEANGWTSTLVALMRWKPSCQLFLDQRHPKLNKEFEVVSCTSRLQVTNIFVGNVKNYTKVERHHSPQMQFSQFCARAKAYEGKSRMHHLVLRRQLAWANNPCFCVFHKGSQTRVAKATHNTSLTAKAPFAEKLVSWWRAKPDAKVCFHQNKCLRLPKTYYRTHAVSKANRDKTVRWLKCEQENSRSCSGAVTMGNRAGFVQFHQQNEIHKNTKRLLLASSNAQCICRNKIRLRIIK